MLGDAADDVALRDYPDESTILVDHRRSADPILGEYLDDRRDGFLRRDGDDTITFLLQDFRNSCFHVSTSWLLNISPCGRLGLADRFLTTCQRIIAALANDSMRLAVSQ